MSPQKLIDVVSEASIVLGGNPFSERPQQAAKVMQVIGIWAQIDVRMSQTLGWIVGDDAKTVIALFDATLSSRTREAMFLAGTEAALTGENRNEGLYFCDRLVHRLRKKRGRRDRFAHHIWAISHQVEDGLCLVNPVILNRQAVMSQTSFRRSFEDNPTVEGDADVTLMRDEFWNNVKLYRDVDLDREVQIAVRLQSLVTSLEMYFHGVAGMRDAGRRKLLEALGDPK